MKKPEENCNPFGKCEDKRIGRKPSFECSENRKRYEYFNKSNDFIVKIRVDECLIKGEKERKCDYLLLNCDKKTAYLIELKGGDLSHAASQILNVLDIFQKELYLFEIHARIVLSKVSQIDINSEDIIKLKKRLKNRLKYQNKVLSETF